jgi:hypothetical protein
MNFSREKAVQNLEDLFHLLSGKSGQIFAFPQIFLTVEYLEEYQIFSQGKSGRYFKFSNEYFRLQKARGTLTFFVIFFSVVNLSFQVKTQLEFGRAIWLKFERQHGQGRAGGLICFVRCQQS